MRRLLLMAVLCTALLTTAACSAPRERIHAGITPVARFGAVDGFWQTPRGGKNGSTSPRRPTFSEAGITNAEEYGVDANIDWGRHRAKIGYARTVLSGTDTLTEDLISQNAPFPAGTSIDTTSGIDWLQAHYQYRFDVPMGRVDTLQLWPGVGYKGAVLHHVFAGSNGERVSRHHGPSMPNLLLDASWRPRSFGNLRFSGSVASSLSVGKSPSRDQVIEALGRAHYDFNGHSSIFVETGYRDVVLRDDQPDQQNWLNLKFGPWIGIGGEFKL